jgi:hypothetical protein
LENGETFQFVSLFQNVIRAESDESVERLLNNNVANECVSSNSSSIVLVVITKAVDACQDEQYTRDTKRIERTVSKGMFQIVLNLHESLFVGCLDRYDCT